MVAEVPQGADGRADVAAEVERRTEMDLAPYEVERLTRALGCKPTELSGSLDQVSKIALQEFVAWLVGRERFSSVSQSDASRVRELFLHVSPSRPLTAEVLARDLLLSPSTATSIIARLRYADTGALRLLSMANAMKEVKAQLLVAR